MRRRRGKRIREYLLPRRSYEVVADLAASPGEGVAHQDARRLNFFERLDQGLVKPDRRRQRHRDRRAVRGVDLEAVKAAGLDVPDASGRNLDLDPVGSPGDDARMRRK